MSCPMPRAFLGSHLELERRPARDDDGTDERTLISPTNELIRFDSIRSIELLRRRLGDGGFVHVTGRTPAAARPALFSRFQDAASPCRVALLALSACGVGLNLTAADAVVFAELCWSPATLEQAEV